MSSSTYGSTTERIRKRSGITLILLGWVLFVLGAEPGWLGLDRSPMTGYVQILVFLVGLAFISLGGYISLDSLWNGTQKTITADIGLRLVATGYLIAVASGMADFLGFSRQRTPSEAIFGVWQRAGVLIGMGVIAIGFILLFPYRRPVKSEEITTELY